jgi:hypothetical protein
VPATALKEADVAPDGTLIEDGTCSAFVLLDSATITPPEPAACDRVTVQLAFPPEYRLAEPHDNIVTDTVAESEIDAVCELPL